MLAVAGPSSDQLHYEGIGAKVSYFEPLAQLRGWSPQAAALSADHAAPASSAEPVAVQAVQRSASTGHDVAVAASATVCGRQQAPVSTAGSPMQLPPARSSPGTAADAPAPSASAELRRGSPLLATPQALQTPAVGADTDGTAGLCSASPRAAALDGSDEPDSAAEPIWSPLLSEQPLEAEGCAFLPQHMVLPLHHATPLLLLRVVLKQDLLRCRPGDDDQSGPHTSARLQS